MPRTVKLALVLLATTAAICLACFWLSEREPTYNGRSLSQWLALCRATGTPQDLRQEATMAVRQIGTNALPLLLTRASAHPPATRNKVAKILDQHPIIRQLTPNSVRSWAHTPPDQTQANEARLGIMILGRSVESATPDLLSIALDPSQNEKAFWAVKALGGIGPVALPALLTIMTNPAASNRRHAAMEIANLGTNALPALPALIQHLKDPDPLVAYSCATVIGALGLDPDQSIPAMLKCIQSPDLTMRNIAADSIFKFGSAAWPAMPELRAAAAREVDLGLRSFLDYQITRFERTTPRNP